MDSGSEEDDTIKARNAAYHAAHRAEINERKRQAYQANLEQKRAAARERMAKARERHPKKYREISRNASKVRKAAKAIAEGRVPGRVGNPKRQTPEERKAYLAEWRAKNADNLRRQDAMRQHRYREERASAEGRVLGPVGSVRRFSDEERLAKRRERCLRYWETHPERRKELARLYHLKNIEKDRQKVRDRRARKMKAEGSFSAADVAYLFKLQKGKCVFCLKKLIGTRFHVDHHVPLSKGGSNRRDNLRLLHNKCNLSKGARDPAEHALRNGLLCW